MREVVQCSFRRYFLLSFRRHSWMSLEIKHQWGLRPFHNFSQSWTETKKSCRHHLSYQLPATLDTILDNYVSWQVLRELHWAGYTIHFQQVPRGPWQAAAPSLYDLWLKECHRAQFFSHFCLISLQNLQGIWWSIQAAMPAMTLMTCSLCIFFPLMPTALSQTSQCWKQGQHSWQRWSQRRSEWGWLEVGSITNCALTLLMWTILQTQSPKGPFSPSPVSITLFSSWSLVMLMCVSPIWTGLLWLSTSG